jgi:tetratricopeptide (TPR) repeat protein
VGLAARARDAAAAGDTRDAYLSAGSALRCWRGPLLANLDARARQHPAAVAVSAERVTVALTYADAALALGHHAAAVQELRPVADAELLDERLHARLLLALAGSGRQTAAIRLFGEVRDRLGEQLGVEPDAELRDAYLRILRGQVPGTRRESPPPSTVREVTAGARYPTPAQLPADVAGFTGRARQLDLLDGMIFPADSEHAAPGVLVLLSGMAGVGKTALAVHWAHRVRDRFPDGQLYLDLRGYAAGPPPRDGEALEYLLHALGVTGGQVPGTPEQAAALYRSLLADRRVLVVLDNAATADDVRRLLPGGHGCAVVVTSRDRLTGLVARDGARRLALTGLTPEETDALLRRVIDEERAGVDPAATAELGKVCSYLPLALRIAAANINDDPHRSVAQYLDELRDGDQLTALTSDGDGKAAVRAAFDLSYDALTDEARVLFRRLSLVPRSDVTADAAAALLDTTPAQAGHVLRRLAGAHLAEQPSAGRYSLHDLLRIYSAERRADDSPAERAAAVGRLYDWYYQGAVAADRLRHPNVLRLPPGGPLPAARFDSADQASAWLEAEHGNLIAAVTHAAAAGVPTMAWLITDALHSHLWQRAGTTEWIAAANAGLHAAQSAGAVREQVMMQYSLTDVYTHVTRYPEASERAARMLELSVQAGWLEGRAAAHQARAVIHWRTGRLNDAAEQCREVLELDRQLGAPGGRGPTLSTLGLIYRDLGRLREAAELFAQALARLTPSDSLLVRSIRQSNLGESLHALGRFDEATRHLTEALAIDRATGSRRCEGETLNRLAAVRRDAGDHRQAIEWATDALDTARDTDDRRSEANTLNTLGNTHRMMGHGHEAIRQHEQAVAVARDIGERGIEADGHLGLAFAHRELGNARDARQHADDALAISRADGYRVLEGQALTALALLHFDSGASATGRHHAEEALVIHRETGHRPGELRVRRLLDEARGQLR